MTGKTWTLTSSRFAACLRMIWKLEERLDKLWPLVCLHVLLFHEHLWYMYIIIATKTKRENSMRVGDESVYCVFLVVLWTNFVFKVPHPSCVQAGRRVRDDWTWCAKYTSFETWSVMTCGKKKPKKGRGRRDEERLGQVGSCWACSLAIRSVTSWCRQVRFFVGSSTRISGCENDVFQIIPSPISVSFVGNIWDFQNLGQVGKVMKSMELFCHGRPCGAPMNSEEPEKRCKNGRCSGCADQGTSR